MSKNTGWKPRNDPEGKYEVECAYCGVKFRTNKARTRYCCYRHKEIAGNASFYQAHKKEIKLAVMLRKTRIANKTARTRTKKADKPDLDAMTPDDLMEFIRNNPHLVNRGR